MHCKACLKDFNPTANAKFGEPDDEFFQILTACPHCETCYYTFVSPDDLVLEEQAKTLIDAERTRPTSPNRQASPKTRR